MINISSIQRLYFPYVSVEISISTIVFFFQSTENFNDCIKPQLLIIHFLDFCNLLLEVSYSWIIIYFFVITFYVLEFFSPRLGCCIFPYTVPAPWVICGISLRMWWVCSLRVFFSIVFYIFVSLLPVVWVREVPDGCVLHELIIGFINFWVRLKPNRKFIREIVSGVRP